MRADTAKICHSVVTYGALITWYFPHEPHSDGYYQYNYHFVIMFEFVVLLRIQISFLETFVGRKLVLCDRSGCELHVFLKNRRPA
jgi:hypothetical protein